MNCACLKRNWSTQALSIGLPETLGWNRVLYSLSESSNTVIVNKTQVYSPVKTVNWSVSTLDLYHEEIDASWQREFFLSFMHKIWQPHHKDWSHSLISIVMIGFGSKSIHTKCEGARKPNKRVSCQHYRFYSKYLPYLPCILERLMNHG